MEKEDASACWEAVESMESASERNRARDLVLLSRDMMLMEDLILRSSGGELECRDESVTVELVDSVVEWDSVDRLLLPLPPPPPFESRVEKTKEGLRGKPKERFEGGAGGGGGGGGG
jgi:hypothetical protein